VIAQAVSNAGRRTTPTGRFQDVVAIEMATLITVTTQKMIMEEFSKTLRRKVGQARIFD
jgi:hypothetical protein